MNETCSLPVQSLPFIIPAAIIGIIPLTENCNIEDLDPTFPVYDIENKKLMIGYCEIFPHAKEIEFQLNNAKYLIDDQYCLNSNCSCTDAALTIIEGYVWKVY